MICDFRNILVLAPHTDDGELGAGGTIAKFVEAGAKVSYVAFSAAEESVPEGMPRDVLRQEVAEATAELGIEPANLRVLEYAVRNFPAHRQEILEDLIRIRAEDSFDLVLIPSLGDVHQDHKVVAEEGLRAFKGTTILCYELVWNNLAFQTTSFVKLDRRHVEAKARAMGKYRSQAHRAYSSEEFIAALAKSRGVQIGAEFAECFEVLRWVID